MPSLTFLPTDKWLVVYPKVIEKHLNEELPFMAAEEILMAAVKRGGDRQALHERLRVHSIAAANQVKEKGLPNDFLQRISDDPAFSLSASDLQGLLQAERYVGRAPQQVEKFLREEVEPLLGDGVDEEAEELFLSPSV